MPLNVKNGSLTSLLLSSLALNIEWKLLGKLFSVKCLDVCIQTCYLARFYTSSYENSSQIELKFQFLLLQFWQLFFFFFKEESRFVLLRLGATFLMGSLPRILTAWYDLMASEISVWFQSPFCLRQTYAAQAICYGELSKEAKRSHLPSHSWLLALCSTTQKPVAAYFGICRIFVSRAINNSGIYRRC